MGTRPGRTASAWIRPLRYCWKPLMWFWMAVPIGVGVNVGSSWLITKRTIWDVSNTPLGWLISHPQITFPLAGALLLLTSLARLAVAQTATQQNTQATPFFSSSLALAQQNRARMRQRLERWYQDFLNDSLEHATWLDLDLADKPDALYNPVPLLVRNAHLPERLCPPDTSIIQVYEDAHQELLILGEPGSGKSTQLYTLGQHLLSLSETDQAAPLPIILALSSWAVKQESLQIWMAEQLTSIYQVPKKLAQQWVENQMVIPLLDGLDEMEEAARPRCIAAINRYQSMHVHPLVVCSRSTEYASASQSKRLALQRAVVVQALRPLQIETALAKGGRRLSGLRTAYKTNTALQELAAAPLLLHLLMLTYQDTPARDLPTKGAVLQQQVFEQYVTRMITRKGNITRYPLPFTTCRLAFLAREMRSRNQTLFAVEHLQPDWLTKGPRLCYRWNIALIAGLNFGLIFGQSGGLNFGLIFGQSGGLVVGLSFGLIGGLIGGLIFGLSFGLIFGQSGGLNGGLSRVLIRGLIGGLSGLLSFWLIFRLNYGLIGGSNYGLIGGLIGVLSFGSEKLITLAEQFQWSWKDVRSGLIFGMIFGLIGGLSVGLIFGLSCGLIGGLIFGLKPNQNIERQTHSPGEGVYRSLKNGLIGGLIGGLISGLSGGLIYGLSGWPIGGLSGWLIFGLDAFLQHMTLRFWLWSAGTLPFRLVSFLEDARARHLLKRVGGTYQFMHRLLLDYFADLTE